MFYKVCGVILSWETFAGKLFRKKCRDIFPGNFGETFPGKSFLPFCENAIHPLGETLCIKYALRVHNTRLESVFIEKHSIILNKTAREIFPTGSFPDFPKFPVGNFPDGKFPGFPEISLGESFPSGSFLITFPSQIYAPFPERICHIVFITKVYPAYAYTFP